MVTLSIVIPTLNEAVELPETLRRARAMSGVVEIIVADAGSTDATCAVAAAAVCEVISCAPSRGGQLRAGSERAKGDVVVLLHADTWLPADAGEAISVALDDPRVVGGGFYKVFRDPPSWLVRGSRFKCWWRMLVARRVVGDQAMFVRRSVLEAIGGVPDVPLMEEFELCRVLQSHGRLVLADAVVSTSARRFAKRGVLRTYGLMWRVTIGHLLAASPQSLAELYRRGG